MDAMGVNSCWIVARKDGAYIKYCSDATLDEVVEDFLNDMRGVCQEWGYVTIYREGSDIGDPYFELVQDDPNIYDGVWL